MISLKEYCTRTTDVYECINRASSFTEGMKKNSCPTITFNESRMLLSEGIDFKIENHKKGGIIVFSTDVNAIKLSESEIKNWIQQKIATLKNRFTSTKMIDKIADKNNLVGWTIGHYLDGRYKAKNGKIYGENSLSLEIVNVSLKKLIKIAEEICRDFVQESVLVHDFTTGRIFFVNPD